MLARSTCGCAQEPIEEYLGDWLDGENDELMAGGQDVPWVPDTKGKQGWAKDEL